MSKNPVELIEIYYCMNDGEHIKDFHQEILIENIDISILIKYRILKHIVEQRKRDGYTVDDLINFFHRMIYMIETMKYQFVSNKNDTLFLIETVTTQGSGVVVVVELVSDSENRYIMRTGFYRATKKILKLLKK